MVLVLTIALAAVRHDNRKGQREQGQVYYVGLCTGLPESRVGDYRVGSEGLNEDCWEVRDYSHCQPECYLRQAWHSPKAVKRLNSMIIIELIDIPLPYLKGAGPSNSKLGQSAGLEPKFGGLHEASTTGIKASSGNFGKYVQ